MCFWCKAYAKEVSVAVNGACDVGRASFLLLANSCSKEYKQFLMWPFHGSENLNEEKPGT